ncbi:MAG TPA: chemotaxis protein CheW [Vicinamibacteria bacterium]|nr:chemotaxis protein CheW [Vicinamibacteria bacterium]
MGRMADARRRARSGASAEEPRPAAPEADAAESRGGDAPSGTPVVLPASGLAEDILSRLPIGAEPVLPEPPGGVEEAPPAAPAALPASGLAEDVLPRDARGAHSLSFFAAPAQEQRAAAEATEHLATFFLDREEYGVDVRQVQEIRRMSEITSVPRAPEFIRGVINLRGRILPVLDLKRKLELGEVEPGRATRIVVVRVKERLLGLLVDGASQVLRVEVSRIEPPPEEVIEKGGDYIRGVAKLDDRLIILVDLERLLAHELRTAGAPARDALAQDGVS